MDTTASPIIPVDDRIVCRPLPLPELPPDALWLPEQTSGGCTRAEVIAAGPGRMTDAGHRMPPAAAVGDVVLLQEHGPTEIEVDGEILLCAPPMLVLAIER